MNPLTALALVSLLATSGASRVMFCSQPQPRAFRAEELLREAAASVLSPSFAVLHRCDASSGVCLGGASCEPSAVQEVPLVFMSHPTVYHTVVAVNHTACGCEYPASNEGTIDAWRRPADDHQTPV